jgi:hypothetical protein
MGAGGGRKRGDCDGGAAGRLSFLSTPSKLKSF